MRLFGIRIDSAGRLALMLHVAAFMSGFVGQLFRQYGLTVVAATLFSLLVSFTLTPMLAARWTRKEEESGLAARLGIIQLQQRLTDVFSRYTISVYANRFDDFGGERFEVDAKPTASPNGVIVGSRIIKTNGEPVALNYLMRQDGSGAWKVIDVYLSGTISELATRRSEFVAVLQRGGADGLVRMIEQRTAALRMG